MYFNLFTSRYCVEFEVIKASKACHKLTPYNLMLEGDRITVRCDLGALIQDGASGSSTTAVRSAIPTASSTTTGPYKEEDGSSAGESEDNSSSSNDEDDKNNNEEGEMAVENAQNMLDPGSNENYEREHHRQANIRSHRDRPWGSPKKSATPATRPPAPTPSFHCRGEGLAGRTMSWSALPAPSCRGKFIRLTVGPPKKCSHAQFIFV
ncbi:uncharacterized protein LOC117591192 [Drosophila guanche]|nr:uncharacterized protein LOC117591192 [Drosophila guanche]